MADRRASSEAKERKKEQDRQNHEVKELVAKVVTKDEKPPRDKHIQLLVSLAANTGTLAPVFRRLQHIKHLGNHPIMVWKALGLLHRLLLVGGKPFLLDDIGKKEQEFVRAIGQQSGAEHHPYSKVAALLAQVMCAKFDFHSRHPDHATNMSLQAAFAGQDRDSLYSLLDDLFTYQHLALTLGAMAFALAQSPAVGMSEASQGCAAWPLIVIIEESIFVYDQMTELMFTLASTGDEKAASRVLQFQDQHRKLRRLWLQAKNNPLISTFVDPPVLDDTAPQFDSEQAKALHEERKRARAEGGDPKDRVIAAQAKELLELRQRTADDRGVIASLESYIQELARGLTGVDPETIAEMQAEALGSGQGRLATLQQQQIAVREELRRLREGADVASATITSLRAVNSDAERQLQALAVEQEEAAAAAAAQGEECKRLRLQVEQLQQRAEESQRRGDTLQGEVDASNTALERDREQRVLLEATYTELNAELERALQAAASDHAKTREELAMATERAAAAAKAAEGREAEAAATIAGLQEDAQQVRATLEAKEAEVERLKSDLVDAGEQLLGALQDDNASTTQLQAAQATLNTVRATNTELSEQVAGLTAAAAQQATRHGEEVGAAQAALASKSAELEAAAAEVAAGREALAAKEDELAALGATHRGRVAELTSQSAKSLQTAQASMESLRVQQVKQTAAKGVSAMALAVEQSRDLIADAKEGMENIRRKLAATLSGVTSLLTDAGRSGAEVPFQPLLLADAVSTACLSLRGLVDDGGPADSAAEVATEELTAAAKAFLGDVARLVAGRSAVGDGSASAGAADTQPAGAADTQPAGADAAALEEQLAACTSAFRETLDRFGVAVDTCAASITARGNRLDGEMGDAAASVDVASQRIEDLMAAAKADMSEKTLAIHGSILDASMTLMRLIRQLITTTTGLQKDIVSAATTTGRISVTQFYKKNSRWIDGLVSGAKAVGAGATVLVDTADGVLRGEAEMEELMVAGQEIAASTAQLVTASRVKAPPNSAHKQDLEATTKQVFDATKALIAAARTAGLEASKVKSAKDFLKLSVTQAKRLEMESQLERELEQEQGRLRGLRRAHYHMNADTEEIPAKPAVAPKPKLAPKPTLPSPGSTC